jgi:hypothetical protein
MRGKVAVYFLHFHHLSSTVLWNQKSAFRGRKTQKRPTFIQFSLSKWRECSRGGYAEYFLRKGGHRIMTVTAWIMLAFYVVVLGGGSVALVTYSLKKNDI